MTNKVNALDVDYIIVGLGLAGIAFAEQLINNNKTFVVFEDNSQTASLVAGGIYNPVILKRYTSVWNAEQQLKKAIPFYQSLEKKLAIQLDIKFSTRKVFKSVIDQNNWFAAADKPALSKYINPQIIHKKIPGVIGDFGFGEVNETGRIVTKELVQAYRRYLEVKNQIVYEKFSYDVLEVLNKELVYKQYTAKRIVFAEGFGIVHNPFFNYLPLREVKGELITIHAPGLNIDFLLKSTLFVLPLGDHYYKVGATFNWEDKTAEPTPEGKNELTEKLKSVINVPYTIVSQSAGIRPTVKDRRPLAGMHPAYNRLAVLNGLGTRGVMIAPAVAENLYNHLENNELLDSEIDIDRFAEKS